MYDISNKNGFIRMLIREQLPHLKTILYDTREEYTKAEPNLQYPVIFKRSIDKWHVNMICRTKQDLVSMESVFFSKIENDEAFQIQQYVDYKTNDIHYYCAVYRYTGKSNRLIILTEQIIDLWGIDNNIKTSHMGNRSINPNISPTFMHYCNYIANLPELRGYIGDIGIDFMVFNGQIAFLELNMRKNRSSYVYDCLNNLNYNINNIKYIAIKKQVLGCIDKQYTKNVKRIPLDDRYVIFISDTEQSLADLNSKIDSLMRIRIENCHWRGTRYYTRG